MQTFLSVSPVYDSPCMTWTVYWTLILCRLPTLIQPALLCDYPECLPPALIFSPNSNFDSALSTLCLKLVTEFCLSDLHSVLIKLHMDPNATDSSLHKLYTTYVRSSVRNSSLLLRTVLWFCSDHENITWEQIKEWKNGYPWVESTNTQCQTREGLITSVTITNPLLSACGQRWETDLYLLTVEVDNAVWDGSVDCRPWSQLRDNKPSEKCRSKIQQREKIQICLSQSRDSPPLSC